MKETKKLAEGFTELLEENFKLHFENEAIKMKLNNAIKFIEKFKDYYSYIPEDDIPELLAILKNE